VKKLCVALVIAAVVIVMCVLCCSCGSEEYPMRFGQFVEIRHETYKADSYMGFVAEFRQYTVYNIYTKVVYIYTVYRNGISIAPYIMRNVYGEMSVGVYNEDTGVIEPIEPYFDDNGVEWVIVG